MTINTIQKRKCLFKWALVFINLSVLVSGCTSVKTTSSPPPTETVVPTSIPIITPTIQPPQIGIPNQRAMWIWNASVIQGEETTSSLLEFLKDKNISVLYLYSGDILTTAPDSLADFIGNANIAEVSIELLFGQPEWAHKENHSQALALIEKAISFSEEQPANQRPIGIHLDVEPYGLSAWDTNQAELIVSSLELLDAIRGQINNSTVPLRFSADIPFWFDTIQATYGGTTRPLNQFIQDVTDQVVIMDYRNIAGGDDGFIALGMNEVTYGTEIGKLVTIGLETTFQTPDKLTFFGFDETTFEQEIAKAFPDFSSQTAFDGIAIHDYDGYRLLIAGVSGTVDLGGGAESCKDRISIGSRLPNAIICSLQYTINDGPIQTVYNNGVVVLKSGDLFTTVTYTYLAPDDTPATNEKISLEAYLFKDNSEPDYSDGRFTSEGVLVLVGENEGSNIGTPGWEMQTGWNRLVAVLVHYFPPEASEIDDRFYISFLIR